MDDPSPLRRIYFGRVTAAPPIAALRHSLDQALGTICAGLPPTLAAAAAEVVASYGRRAAGAAPPSFFALFYPPLWSWIHWATAAAEDPAIVTGQAMAMFLHLFDDHLADGQLRCDPLHLQLRTAAWQRLEQCAQKLAGPSAEGQALWHSDVARYFAAIYRPPAALDLDGYCARFRDQMATCVAIPTLALLRQGSPAAAEELRQILFGLGVAWRLLDDVQDAYADLLAGEQTILYLLLDEAARAKWTRCQLAGPADREQWPQLVEVLFRSGVLKQVLGRCCAELADAARLASGRGWDQLAEELRQLRHPVYDLVGRLP